MPEQIAAPQQTLSAQQILDGAPDSQTAPGERVVTLDMASSCKASLALDKSSNCKQKWCLFAQLAVCMDALHSI